jgi:hypothetical protein
VDAGGQREEVAGRLFVCACVRVYVGACDIRRKALASSFYCVLFLVVSFAVLGVVSWMETGVCWG